MAGERSLRTLEIAWPALLPKRTIKCTLDDSAYSCCPSLQVDESLFQTKMQPIATMMEADRKRAVALSGISKWKVCPSALRLLSATNSQLMALMI